MKVGVIEKAVFNCVVSLICICYLAQRKCSVNNV